MEQNGKETFKYTYSAKQQEEVESIRKKYTSPQEDKMEQLRKLDASVGKRATAAAIALGVVGTLIMGFGMSTLMSDFGGIFGGAAVPLGIATGVAGIAMLICAYPVYNVLIKRERAKAAPEILRLTDELLKK